MFYEIKASVNSITLDLALDLILVPRNFPFPPRKLPLAAETGTNGIPVQVF